MKLPKIVRALNTAQAGVDAGLYESARSWIVTAYNMSLDTTFPRTAHINMITLWGFMDISLRERGQAELADHCRKMSNLLQSRFDAGDYYREV